MPTRDEALLAVKTIMAYLGEDPTRTGLRDTPRRVIDAWRNEWGRGYHEDPEKIPRLFTDGQVPDTMVVIRDIQYHSHCEHHITPHFGLVTIGYLPDPNKGVLGLSKAARIVDLYARRLTVQERLGQQIADFFMDHVTSFGCGVVIRGTHLCMVSRGVQQPNSQTVTSALRGAFFDNETTRSEFLRLAHA